MPKNTIPDHEILEAALAGFQHSLAVVDTKIADIRRQLGIGGGNHTALATGGTAPVKRTLGAAARRRIAAAQKKRWAKFRKEHKT